MTDITPELVEVLETAVESRLLDVHTSIPGTVQGYDASTQTATIELGVKRALDGEEDGQIVFETLPVLQNVRVMFPRTKKYMMTFPLEAGDEGDVHFSEAPDGQWRAVEGVAFPDTVSRFDLSGAKFYPTGSRDADVISDTITDGARFGVIGGAQILIKTDDTMKLDNGSGTIEIKPSGQVDINGNFTVDP
jgi:hypothetical protein